MLVSPAMIIPFSFPGSVTRVLLKNKSMLQCDNIRHGCAFFRRFVMVKNAAEVHCVKSSPIWQLCAAVFLARPPLVTSSPLEIEKEYFELLREQEYEQSVLSLWEMEHNRQTKLMNAVESGDRDPQDIDFKATNQDIEDENDGKYREFIDANHQPLLIDEDMQNINRKIHETLVYIVKQKLGNDEIWLLPGLQISDGETMRQCGERTLRAFKSDDVDARILSNAPSSFYKYKFPKDVRLKSGKDGAKIFIYSAVASRSVMASAGKRSDTLPAEFADPSTLDYAWVTTEEMKKRLKPKYFNTIQKLLH